MRVKIFNIFILYVVFCVIVATFFFCPSELAQDKQTCYYVLCLQLLIIWMLNVYLINKNGFDIIEPIGLFSLIHILMFEVTPLICLWKNEIEWFGLDLWGGCIKGTCLSTLCYMCVLFSYYRSGWHWVDTDVDINEGDNIVNENVCLYLNILIWLITFGASVFLFLRSGLSLSYMLTLGANGSFDIEGSSSGLEFLSTIAYGMIPAYLYIFSLSRSRFIKIITFYLMAISFMARGFRFILVAVMISPFILVYLRKQKRPKLWQIFTIGLVLLLMIGFVGNVRNDIRSGNGISGFSSQTMSVDIILDMVLDNFSIVKTFYGIVEKIPTSLGYTLGNQMILYSCIMLIPRLIWPQKPQPATRSVISTAISPYASSAGTAYPYVGEYYHEFGVLGVVVFGFILGKMLAYLKRFMYKTDIHSQIMYASLFPLILQILIRGYTPSNVYLVIFVALPIIISKHMTLG